MLAGVLRNFYQTPSLFSTLCLLQGESESVSYSVVSDSATPWTVALQAPVSVGFSRQEYCNGMPFPSPGDLPIPGMEPGSPALQADSLQSEPPGKTFTSLIILIRKTHSCYTGTLQNFKSTNFLQI